MGGWTLNHKNFKWSQDFYHENLLWRDSRSFWTMKIWSYTVVLSKCSPRCFTSQCQSGQLEDGNYSNACRLSGEKQTLAHILNHCLQALNMHHFNTRHDEAIASFIAQHLPKGCKVTADLPGYQSFVFPSTSLQPTNNLTMLCGVIQCKSSGSLCFETGYEAMHILKKNPSDTSWSKLMTVRWRWKPWIPLPPQLHTA